MNEVLSGSISLACFSEISQMYDLFYQCSLFLSDFPFFIWNNYIIISITYKPDLNALIRLIMRGVTQQKRAEDYSICL